MLKKYRRQFVTLNMCLVGAVLLVTLIFVGFYMYRDYYEKMESTMNAVLEPLNSSVFDLFDFFYDRRGGDAPEEAPESPAPEDEMRQNITTIFYNAKRGECSVISRERNYDSDTIVGIVSEVARRTEDFGRLRDYGVFYCRTGSDGSYKIAVADTAYLRDSMRDLILILLAIFVGAMVIFFFISRAIAGMAARPLEEAMKREKQFVADASHDLKTPLTVILANTEILRQDPEATVAEQQKWIDSTADAAENMQGMIQEMLTLSRVEDSEEPLVMEEVDFSAVAERSALQLESVAYENGICMDTRICEGVRIVANEACLQRISECLIGNAIKYEPEGGSVTVTLALREHEAVLSVSNPGSDITPEELPHIFERFYRSDKTRSTTGGHGLGLAIAKRMTERMGGSILAESGPGAGTRFSVSFPLPE